MGKLTKKDKELIELAVKVARKNPNKTIRVGCVLVAKNGKIFKGTNLMSSHSICAEQVALGSAFAQGVNEFDTIVSVVIDDEGNYQVVSPCCICRYNMGKYGLQKLNVIVRDIKNGEVLKVKLKDLIPYPNESPITKGLK